MVSTTDRGHDRKPISLATIILIVIAVGRHLAEPMIPISMSIGFRHHLTVLTIPPIDAATIINNL